MAFAISDLHIEYSGGVANDTASLSLGGAMSETAASRIVSQSVGAPVNITGVVINNAWNNTQGNGTLSWTTASNLLRWRPPGDAVFNGQTIVGDGVYVLGSSAGYIEVAVTQASLPVVDAIDTMGVAATNENLFASVAESTALLGGTFYRCVYLHNTNPVNTASNVRIWISNNTEAQDTIDIALDSNGLNAQAIGPLADQEDSGSLLSGLTFSAPTTYAGGILVNNIPATQKYAVWLRQTIPVEARGTVLNNFARIAIAADV
jgi:hypothetical protein